MPAVRMYEVTETREVKVRAESPADAVRVAATLLENRNEEGPGDPRHEIKTTDISAREL